jgi:hypothetical protein
MRGLPDNFPTVYCHHASSRAKTPVQGAQSMIRTLDLQLMWFDTFVLVLLAVGTVLRYLHSSRGGTRPVLLGFRSEM